MFEDSLAPSHTPNDLFSADVGCRFVAPLGDGYLIEAEERAFSFLAARAASSDRVTHMSDISRVESVSALGRDDVLRGRSLEELWERGLECDGGRLFTTWLMPYASEQAREALIQQFIALAGTTTLTLPSERPEPTGAIAQTAAARAIREYRASAGVGRSLVRLQSPEDLRRIVASGTVFRMDPVRPVTLSEAPASPANENVVPRGVGPIVACIDGGMTNPAYAVAEAWRVTPLVSDGDADTAHGNAITSLVTHAAALNPSLQLPEIECRFGVAQAVPHPGAAGVYLPDDLFDLLTRISTSQRETRVWNLSFNLADHDDDPEHVSDFGHQISRIARIAGVLPVVSIGNRRGTARSLLPPGDAEAALTVGGRVADAGAPGAPCSACCSGPGPDGMLKPEVSWFSPVAVAGGDRVVGSSYATALVSGLAAHTFERLKEPTPDLVKALLISKAERPEHDPSIGWGTPFRGAAPWECDRGTVTLAWNAALEPGFDYYWRDIPIPSEMIDDDGRLVGGASLTAVLEPITSPFAGPNYFSTRVEVALQHLNHNDKWGNLLGTMRESTLDEETARSDLKKWNPIRHHRKDSFRVGASTQPRLRVRARLYTRNLFQPGHPTRGGIPPQRVAFVLTLRTKHGDDGVYNSMVQDLGAFVDSAVIEQNIEIQI
ncbi:S8 family serine peptidase [Phenylobacterium deserti]|nr:S8 family serine peptidase [Phenylobacterium deserti]